MRLSILPFLSFLSFPFDALGPRGGPYFLPLQKVGKDWQRGLRPLWDPLANPRIRRGK